MRGQFDPCFKKKKMGIILMLSVVKVKFILNQAMKAQKGVEV